MDSALRLPHASCHQPLGLERVESVRGLEPSSSIRVRPTRRDRVDHAQAGIFGLDTRIAGKKQELLRFFLLSSSGNTEQARSCEDRRRTTKPHGTHANVDAAPSLQSISISRFPPDVDRRLHLQCRHLDADRRPRLAHLPLEPFVVFARIRSVPGGIPIFLFTLIGGVVADRTERRKILLISQYIQMASAAALTLLVTFGVVHVWQILCLSFVSGFAQAFGGPAYQALIPTLVDREDMPNAIALNSIQFNLAVTVGPALAGITLASSARSGASR